MKHPKPTDTQIIDTCKTSKSMSEACAILNMHPVTFKKRAQQLKVYAPNTSGKGITKQKPSIPLNEILAGRYPQYSTNRLKHRMYKEGIKEKRCEFCGITEWRETHISFELDHIDGNNHNHKLENLRILCPNCHSQTETFGTKKHVQFKPIQTRRKKSRSKNPSGQLSLFEKTRAPRGYGEPKARKYTSKDEYHNAVRIKWEEDQKSYIEIIKNSNIDFSKLGWCRKVSDLIGIRHQKVNKWMKRIMPDFYEEKCFKRVAKKK